MSAAGPADIERAELAAVIAALPARPQRQDRDGFMGPDPSTPGERSEVELSFDYDLPERSSIRTEAPARSAVGATLPSHIGLAEQQLIARLGHRFRAPEHLAVALTHPSWRNEHPDVQIDNQRYEFVGDLVLGLAIGHALFARLSRAGEGDLSALKAFLVREATLAEIARAIGLGAALRLGKGEDQSGGRERSSVLADALEAVIAAVALDAGSERAIELVLRLFGQHLDEAVARHKTSRSTTELRASTASYKSALQQQLASLGAPPPEYVVVAEFGPPEARRFRVEVRVALRGQALAAIGEGSSKKAAEALAAERLYIKLPAVGG